MLLFIKKVNIKQKNSNIDCLSQTFIDTWGKDVICKNYNIMPLYNLDELKKYNDIFKSNPTVLSDIQPLLYSVNDKKYIDILKKDDTHFAKEYAGENELNIVIADIEYVEKMTLNLGNITAHIFHTVSPHSEDTTCIYIPEEKVLFLGDSTSEDFFNGGYMDKRKLQHLIERIYSIDCDYCVLSHCEPLKKNELLAYLNTLK